jgi:hypothetical protein
MKTEVIMKREIFGTEISQCSKSEFFSATDLCKSGNKWRIMQGMQPFDMSAWLNQSSTKEFMKSMESKFGIVKISGRGRGNHTWVHPYVFIDMALAISPELKIEVYQWLHDHLLAYRNDSGDSYKRMVGALYNSYPNKAKFPTYIIAVADFIRDTVVKVKDWQTATEDQLKLRDKIHDNIALLADLLPPDDAVRIGANKAYDLLSKPAD